MNGTYTKAEREHVGRVRELDCSLCDEPGPSEAHHIEQGSHFTVCALCVECHRDSRLGWHGERFAWKIRKMTELDALNVTIGRLHACA